MNPAIVFPFKLVTATHTTHRLMYYTATSYDLAPLSFTEMNDIGFVRYGLHYTTLYMRGARLVGVE